MKKKFSKSVLMTALITGLCIGGVQSAFAAENLNTFALDEYVVTATRTMKQLQEVPASVSVVTAKDIEERNVTSLPDALQMLPGIYKNRAIQGGIQMRGFGSTDILVMVDGMQMNNAYNNSVDWEMIPVDNIERIEVVRGAASSLYGGRAVGGVINIITKENQKTKGAKIDAVLDYGSNNTWKKSLLVDVKANEKISFGVGYENRKSDGYANGYEYTGEASALEDGKTYDAVADKEVPQNSDGKYVLGYRGDKEYENETISANVKYNFDEHKSLKYYFAHTDSEYRYGTPKSNVIVEGKEFFKGNVDVGLGNNLALKPSITSSILGYEGAKESDLHTLAYNDDDNKVSFKLGYLDIKRNGYSTPSGAKTIYHNGAGSDSYYPGETYSMDFQKAWENVGKHNILLGANFSQEAFDQEKISLTNWRNHNSVDNSKYKDGLSEGHGGKARNFALFLQDEYKMSDPLTMYLGVRFDHFKKFDGYSVYYNKNGSLGGYMDHDSESYNEISPKLAFDFKANDTTNYFISYGHSFNPPELYRVYRISGYDDDYASGTPIIANPDLEPETSDTFEIGMKKKLDNDTNLGISLYHIKTEDKVASVTHEQPTGQYINGYKMYENVGTEERDGIEFELTHKFDDTWSTYLNYAWQHGKIKSNSTANKKNNYDIPKHLLHAGVEYNKDRFTGIVECQYVSERQSPDAMTGEYGSEDAFFIVSTALNYKLSKGVTLQFGIDNLFDREFYCDEVTSGRTYNVGLRYSF